MKASALTHCISLLARTFVLHADVRTQQMMQRWTIVCHGDASIADTPAAGLRT